MRDVAELAATASTGKPSDGLAAVAAMRRVLEHLEAVQVGDARTDGWSWEQIADALGVSKQAVHKKYAHRLHPDFHDPSS